MHTHKCPLCEMGVPIKKIDGPFRIVDEETGEDMGIYFNEEAFNKIQKQLASINSIGSMRIKLILKKGEKDVLQQDDRHKDSPEVRQGREGGGGNHRDNGEP